MNKVIEEWRDVLNFEGLYQVSNLGRVKSLQRETAHIYKQGGTHTITEKYIKLFINKFGYLNCFLYKNGKRKAYKVHRLVALAFIPNIYNLPQINHKDKNKQNNNIENLEWCSNKYNAQYSNCKAVVQYDLNNNKLYEWHSISEASSKTGISIKSISKCCLNKRKTAGKYIWEFKGE